MCRFVLLSVSLVAFAPGPAWGQGEPAAQASVYEGWRQYSVHCARCHGQDVLGNPVAANLLESAAPGGPSADRETFVKVVRDGRPERGMPGLGDVMSPEQIEAVYVYVKGRAEKKVPPGRPKAPAG
jgi:cytochrome c oxidase cbb3-type subunit 3